MRPCYARLCDARVRGADWVVYTIGIAPEQLPDVVRYAAAQPADF
jgi:hypothetical protein